MFSVFLNVGFLLEQRSKPWVQCSVCFHDMVGYMGYELYMMLLTEQYPHYHLLVFLLPISPKCLSNLCLKQTTTHGTATAVTAVEPLEQTAAVEPVLASTARFCGERAVRHADDRVANGALDHTFKVQCDVLLEHCEGFEDEAVLEERKSQHRYYSFGTRG